METINASMARAQLPALLNQVEAGGEVTITRNGRPVAVMVSPDRIQAPVIDVAAQMIEVERLLNLPPGVKPITGMKLPAGWTEEMIRNIRADRDARG